MLIKRIVIRNFRNIEGCDIQPGADNNIFCGNNAQGKTNLLEAVFISSWGKSFRTSRESELIRTGCESALISVDFESGGREQNVEIVFSLTGKRRININSIPAKRASELFGRLATVLFIPSHLDIIRNGPDERRKFLDMAVCQISERYTRLLVSYKRCLEQRNRLIRDISYSGGSQLEAMLDAWDEKLADLGGALRAKRSEYSKLLFPCAQRIYASLSGGELMELSSPDMTCSAKELLAELKENRAADIRSGFTSTGPHRDDIITRIEGRDARKFASQGQQRSAVIALKLAEAELLEQTTGEPPVLLLDDVLSELDALRRGFLLNGIEKRQRIVTCCEKTVSGGRVFTVENGKYTAESYPASNNEE